MYSFSAGENILILFHFEGKAHLRKAIIRHEEALRLHSVCKMLRKMDILQEVLSHAHARSLEKYSDIDQEDDFCEVAEAPEIQCECLIC